MTAVLQDPALQAHLDEKGYVLVPGFLDSQQIEALKAYYLSLPNHQHSEIGFHVSLYNEAPGYARTVRDKIRDLVQPAAQRHFKDYQIFTASFVIKESDPRAIIPPHQDWTFVDESQFSSYSVWIPLVDTNEKNGTLGFIPGSHKFFQEKRCSPSPQAQSPIGKHLFTVFPYIQLVEAKAGDTLIFDNRTIHASPPNISGAPRICAGIALTQKTADFYHYYMLPDNQPPVLAEYKVNEDFYVQHHNDSLSAMHERGEKPTEFEQTGEYPKKDIELEAKEIRKLIESYPGNRVNEPFMKRMAQQFGYQMQGSVTEEVEAGMYGTPDWMNNGNTQAEGNGSEQKKRAWYQVYSLGNIVKEIDYRIRKSLGIWKEK